jgi:hypothetical protein
MRRQNHSAQCDSIQMVEDPVDRMWWPDMEVMSSWRFCRIATWDRYGVYFRLDGLRVETSASMIAIRYSVGWTDYIPGESLDDLLKRADAMLYANKRNPKGLLVSSTFAE